MLVSLLDHGKGPMLILGLAIQGKDCLVQKFRNSSVMLEHPSFRPKVLSLTLHLSLFATRC